MRALALILLLAVAVLLCSQPAPPERVGPLRDGGFLLNNGWRIKPAGKQIPLDTFPMSTALSPDGRFLLVLCGGFNPPSISVFDTESMKQLQRVLLPDGWLGLAFTPNGRLVYVGGGSRASIFEFTFSPEGKLEPARTFTLIPEAERKHTDFIGDVAVSPDGRLVYAAALYRNQVLVVNPQSGMVIERVETGRRPYRILFHPDGKSFFVSSWADGTIHHHEAESGRRISVVRVAPHPTDMVWRDRKSGEEDDEASYRGRIFVAAANTNNVYTIGVTDSKEARVIETINVSLTPRQPAGMTPSALALSPDRNVLYVVCSDANAVAVADVTLSRSRMAGFLPTGWYPTAVRALADGRIVVLNGRGGGSHANPGGPNPTKRAAPVHLGGPGIAYVARIQTGTASVIDPFNDNQLVRYSNTVLDNSPYRDQLLDAPLIPADNPIPPDRSRKSPIEHVIYIVKENRTYDQVFGDLGKGNGDASLMLFNADCTPNHRKLAREFVLLDNFYVNSDVSADGHNWSTAAIASDYVQRMWPNSYAARRKYYDYEGQEPAAVPPAGYIWTNAAAAGIKIRNYGYFATNHPKPASDGIQITAVRDPVLAHVTNMQYRSFDLDYPDIDRAKVFLRDLANFDANNDMPQLILIRLGNDHTSGAAAGKIAPLSAMADNDLAFGMIVEAVSRSKFWPTTAIFVLEDDAQNGPDHVDSHRSPAFVISPWVKRGIIDSTMYNTTSMLRTIELILGLRPMTTFDAGARPMWFAFQAKADLRGYTGEKPKQSLDERNAEQSAAAARSARLDFSEADRIDDDELNDILWRTIRRDDPPAPVRSYFSR